MGIICNHTEISNVAYHMASHRVWEVELLLAWVIITLLWPFK